MQHPDWLLAAEGLSLPHCISAVLLSIAPSFRPVVVDLPLLQTSAIIELHPQSLPGLQERVELLHHKVGHGCWLRF
ncbi:hypothetical protein GDO78_005265 [Eleutherodactylus coqui]|uniref:Uncharacterized protein n=1 Tax=Eleutherodactylus coqui TaxID=57060 RepID=A0A8J6FJJ4_ELECQ|nr:hypothetical protein GDO78_005265 [Eleutherodactylus coqui]